MEKYGDDEQQRPAPLIRPARRVASAANGRETFAWLTSSVVTSGRPGEN